METDIQASWVCGIWCGVAERLVRERVADPEKAPLTEAQTAQIRRLVQQSVVSASYLREPAAGVLAVLNAAGPGRTLR